MRTTALDSRITIVLLRKTAFIDFEEIQVVEVVFRCRIERMFLRLHTEKSNEQNKRKRHVRRENERVRLNPNESRDDKEKIKLFEEIVTPLASFYLITVVSVTSERKNR